MNVTWTSQSKTPFKMSCFQTRNHKFLVTSQARNNSEPYDEEKSVTENWDSNPIIVYALWGTQVQLLDGS